MLVYTDPRVRPKSGAARSTRSGDNRPRPKVSSCRQTPVPPPTSFRYHSYDTSGEVAEPGSYAFLANPADTTSASPPTRACATARRPGCASTRRTPRASRAPPSSIPSRWATSSSGGRPRTASIRYRVIGVSAAIAATGATRELRDHGSYSYTYDRLQRSGVPATSAAAPSSSRASSRGRQTSLRHGRVHGDPDNAGTRWRQDVPTGILDRTDRRCADPVSHHPASAIPCRRPSESPLETSDPAEARRLIRLDWREVLPEGWTLRRADLERTRPLRLHGPVRRRAWLPWHVYICPGELRLDRRPRLPHGGLPDDQAA